MAVSGGAAGEVGANDYSPLRLCGWVLPAVFDGYGVAIVPDRPCYADEIATPRKYGVGMTGWVRAGASSS